jgi:hypothetical protein
VLAQILAQLDADTVEQITALVGEWTPILAAIVPFILGVAVRYDAVAEAKQAIAVIAAALIAGITLAQEDWTEITVQLVMARAGIAWLISETAYRLVNGVLANLTPRNLNQWLAPKLSLVPGLKTDEEKTVQLQELRSAA